jgi:hypothetical protein
LVGSWKGVGRVLEGVLEARRKAKRRARDRRRRRRAGCRTRKAWLAKSRTRQQPWKLEGVSRATWYRRHRATPQNFLDKIAAQVRLIYKRRIPVSKLLGKSA